jgi:hypothetical protein
MRSTVLLFGVVLLASAAAAAEPKLFDFGTADSALREGFARVTPASIYTKETGFGWKAVDGLRAQHHHYPAEWQRNESRGVDQPPPIYTNELTCDAIWSEQPRAFLVDLPPGEYCVYLLCGRSQGTPRDYAWFDVTAGTASSTVKIPGPYIFEKRLLRTKVADGPLVVELKPTSHWIVAGMLVYAVGDEKQLRTSLLDALEAEIYFLPPAEAAKWKETKHVDDRPMPQFGDADRRRGYAVFARHWSEVVYPNTVPRAHELSPRLRIFASPGEYEPATFTVHPLKDIAGAKVTATALTSGKATIAAENIDIRSVRFMRVRPNYSLFNSYHIAPDVLMPIEPMDLTAGCNQRYWITVRVPVGAQPGVYEGRVTFRPEAGEAAEVPLLVRVLPIVLKTNPEHIYGMYYRDPLAQLNDRASPQANDYHRYKAERERQDMVDHGMNTYISSVSGLARDDEGRWTIDGEETERRLAVDRKYGLADRPLVVSFAVEHWYRKLVDPQGLGSHLRLVRSDVPDSFFAEVTRMVEVIEQERKRRGWPEFLYYPIDEPSTSEPAVNFMVNVLRAIKRVPGVRTYVTADPSHDQFEPMWPYVDIWCCQPFVFGHDRIRQLSRERKIEFWCYPNHISGENDHTPVRGARMTWGFGFWRSGFRALIPWIYQSSTGDPWNYLDGSSMDFFNRSTPEGDPIPVAMWEAYREGIDDGRYLYTLHSLATEARQRSAAVAQAAARAERTVRELWDSIEMQEKYKYDGLWSGADFDARRWLLAQEILRLQEAMAKGE